MALSNKSKYKLAYLLGDLAMSGLAIFLYNICRYYIMEEEMLRQGFASLGIFMRANMVMVGQLCFPVAMAWIYWLSGYYNEVFRKSMLQEISTTFLSSFVCTMLVFFVALINDTVIDHYQNYEMLLVLWGMIFVCIYPVRLFITLLVKRRVARSCIEFPTLVVGCNDRAKERVAELQRLKGKLGYNVVGFISADSSHEHNVMGLPVFDVDNVEKACRQYGITDIIVVPQHRNAQEVLHGINKFFSLNLPIKVFPEDADLFLSRGRLATVYGASLIDISYSNMTECETNLKRTSDVVLSFVALVLLLPLFAIVAALIKCKSGGPVIFKQKRVGLHGKPFTIYKFRTMVVDAEADGKPRLTRVDDERVLPFGHFMRKYRIDELPQFWNVLIGDMSIVGPRPERQYFIDQIVEQAPYYTLLFQVRPGITSLGMVKYGYASSVEAMVERMRYDIIYIENISFVTDLKIVIYTIRTVVTGKGL